MLWISQEVVREKASGGPTPQVFLLVFIAILGIVFSIFGFISLSMIYDLIAKNEGGITLEKSIALCFVCFFIVIILAVLFWFLGS